MLHIHPARGPFSILLCCHFIFHPFSSPSSPSLLQCKSFSVGHEILQGLVFFFIFLWALFFVFCIIGSSFFLIHLFIVYLSDVDMFDKNEKKSRLGGESTRSSGSNEILSCFIFPNSQMLGVQKWKTRVNSKEEQRFVHLLKLSNVESI